MSTKWHKRFLEIAHEVSTWSKDTTQVGAVIIDSNRNPRGFGYNGMPRGLDDQPPERQIKPLKNWLFEHAERNVLYACARNGISCDGCSIYVTHWPCADCTRGIIQAGIQEVIVDEACMDPSGIFYPKWREQIEVSQSMLNECGIKFSTISINS